jgi:hypothetical protein
MDCVIVAAMVEEILEEFIDERIVDPGRGENCDREPSGGDVPIDAAVRLCLYNRLVVVRVF